MRHAFPCAMAVVALLLLLGAPFLGARFGLPDDRVLPTNAQSRQVGETLRTEFPGNEATATSIVIPDARSLTGDDVAGYAAALSNVPGVVAVSAPGGSYVRGPRRGPPAVRNRGQGRECVAVGGDREPVVRLAVPSGTRPVARGSRAARCRGPVHRAQPAEPRLG